jgi:hypothetical protein
VLWLLAVQIAPQTAKIPHFAPQVPAEDTQLQPGMLVPTLTYPLMPTTSRPTYQAKPIAHTPCSGLVQHIFSSPARLIYISTLLTTTIGTPPS